MLVAPYHTRSHGGEPVYHVHDDCPAGSVLLAAGDAEAGLSGLRLCKLCEMKNITGRFHQVAKEA